MRTRLAWRRTGLSMVVAGLGGLEVLVEAFGARGAAPAFVAVVGGVALAVVAGSRARHLGSALEARLPLPDGGSLFAAAVLVSGCGAGVLVLVATRST